MKKENGNKTKTGLVITVAFALILGVAGITFAGWGGHGTGRFMHDGGIQGGGYAHNGGCQGAGYTHGSMPRGF